MTLQRADIQRHLNRIPDDETRLLSEPQALLHDEAAEPSAKMIWRRSRRSAPRASSASMP